MKYTKTPKIEANNRFSGINIKRNIGPNNTANPANDKAAEIGGTRYFSLSRIFLT